MKSDGTVRAWGNNGEFMTYEHGQLGDGTNTNSLVPVVTIGMTNLFLDQPVEKIIGTATPRYGATQTFYSSPLDE